MERCIAILKTLLKLGPFGIPPMKRFLLWTMVVAIAASSCTTMPNLSLSQVIAIQIGNAHPREATHSEIKELVEAYNRVQTSKNQEVGTTPDISIAVLLRSGQPLHIHGGHEPFQIVSHARRQTVVHGSELQALLDRLMREDP